MNDTTSEIEQKVRELMMRRSGAERVEMASDMFDAVRTLVMASFSPNLAAMEAKLRLCERFYAGEVDLEGFSAALRRLRYPQP